VAVKCSAVKSTMHITFEKARIVSAIGPCVWFVSNCCAHGSADGTGAHLAGRRRR